MKKNSFIIVLASVTIIFIVIGFFFFEGNSSTNSPADDYSNGNYVGVDLKEGEAMEVVADDTMELSEVNQIAIDEEGLVADLYDITIDTGGGMAYLFRDGALYHYVEANLPEPAEGNVYEGWLVSQLPTLKFFSTGIMELNSDGTYTLIFMTDAEYPEYDHVVITEETVVDATPETHILEGTLQ